MKLNLEQIRAIACGAEYVEEENGRIRLHRFTKEQEELYRKTGNEPFYQKTFSTAGIRLRFCTDSTALLLKTVVGKSTTRTYFAHDVLVNGEKIGSLDNFSDAVLPEVYPQAEFPMGEFEKEFALGDGEKEVCIHFPWSVVSEIAELSLDDGASVVPVKYEKKILMFGDSITHGYDALNPSMRYAARLADALEAEEFNKAIGGEVFFPALAQSKETVSPNFVTVAYGTNDWNRDRETFRKNSSAFYAALSEQYPDAEIFAITPIWRKDLGEERLFGDFMEVESEIRNATAGLPNVRVIPGFDFVPKEERYFADLRLHPNDAGFAFYFERLHAAIRNETE